MCLWPRKMPGKTAKFESNQRFHRVYECKRGERRRRAKVSSRSGRLVHIVIAACICIQQICPCCWCRGMARHSHTPPVRWDNFHQCRWVRRACAVRSLSIRLLFFSPSFMMEAVLKISKHFEHVDLASKGL